MTSKRGGTWRRRVRIGLAVLLALLAGLALLGWLKRDLPRRRLEGLLAQELGARIELGRLEILGLERFLLHHVVIREMRARPWIARLQIERIDVYGSLGQILAGRYRDLRLTGVELVLAPSDADAEPAAAAAVAVERLTIERGRIVVDAGDARAELELAGQLREIGGALDGRLELSSPGFSLAPIAALLGNPGGVEPRGSVEQVAATLHLTDDRVELEARSRRSSIDAGPRTIELPGLAVTASASWRDDGKIRLDIDPELPGIDETSLSALLGADGALQSGEAELIGMDLGMVTAFLGPLPAGVTLDGRADLTLLSENPGRVDFDLRADLRRLVLAGSQPSTDAQRLRGSATGTLELELAPRRMRRVAYRLRADARRTHIASDVGIDLTADGVEIEVEGTTELPSLFTSYEARADVGALSGRVGGIDLAPPRIAVGLRSAGRAGDRSVAGSLALDVAGFGEAEIDGKLTFGPVARGELDWRLHGIELEQLIAGANERGAGIPSWVAASGELSAAGAISGELGAPALHGTVELDSLGVAPITDEPWSFVDGSAAMSFAWPHPAEPIDVRSIDMRGQARLEPVDAVPLSLLGSARIDPAAGTLRLGLPQIVLGELAHAEVAGDWNFADRSAAFETELHGAALARWRTFLEPWIGRPLPAFELSGELSARLESTWDDGLGLRGGGTALLSGSSVAHEDGSRVIEAPDMAWELDFGIDRAGEGRSWLDARAPVGGFLVLWGAVFGDYSALEGRLDLHLERSTPTGGWVGDANLALDESTELRASLRAEPARAPTYEASVTMRDLAGAFSRWVHDPLAVSLPALERMEADGRLDARFAGRLAPSERTIEGRVAVADGRLEGRAGRVFVRGLQLELPVDLRYVHTESGFELDEGHTHRGRLEFERLGFGGVELERTATDLFVRSDSVGLDEGLAMPFLEGVLVFEELTASEMLDGSPSLASGLLLSGIRLDALSEALGILPLEGTAEGYFPRMKLTEGRLEVEGGGEVDVFGGTLTVRDISGENLMSRFPKLTFSADLTEIDLLQVTHTFDFGDMSGILEGEIDRCELFRWTPVRFAARFETVPRKGVPQTVHVKAINNIAILGTGGAKPGVLDRGLHRFLDRYTYRKLGVTMTLDNDAFVLRGLERRGSRELFLKGKPPFSIEVVNVQPGRSIGFRSMLERVKRLDFSVEPEDARQVLH